MDLDTKQKLANLINGSMTWSDTREGTDYWRGVCGRLGRTQSLPYAKNSLKLANPGWPATRGIHDEDRLRKAYELAKASREMPTLVSVIGEKLGMPGKCGPGNRKLLLCP